MKQDIPASGYSTGEKEKLHSLTLNESIISQHMQRAAACFSGLLICWQAPLFRPTQDLKCCALPRDALLQGDTESYHLWRAQYRIIAWPELRKTVFKSTINGCFFVLAGAPKC